MHQDPFTLRVALDVSGSARGELYLDDGDSYAHEAGNFVWREFSASPDGKTRAAPLRIRSKDLTHAFPEEAVDGVSMSTYNPRNTYAESVKTVRVERIVVLGLAKKPESVKTNDGHALEWDFDEGLAATGKQEGLASVLTIKNPNVLITSDWDITIS